MRKQDLRWRRYTVSAECSELSACCQTAQCLHDHALLAAPDKQRRNMHASTHPRHHRPSTKSSNRTTWSKKSACRATAKHNYYPVKIGQVIQNRYRVIEKLGYGTSSTVWLCRDTSAPQAASSYVALKFYISNQRVNRELPIYQHINGVRSELQRAGRVRRMLDSFELEGPQGRQVCLVH